MSESISYFSFSSRTCLSSLGSSGLILIALLIASGNLDGWAVANTMLIPSNFTLLKAPYPTAVCGSNIVLYLS